MTPVTIDIILDQPLARLIMGDVHKTIEIKNKEDYKRFLAEYGKK